MIHVDTSVVLAHLLAEDRTPPARLWAEPLVSCRMQPLVLQRALEPFPASVRTLDALHLASVEFLRTNGQAVMLASSDERMTTAAQALGIALFAL